MEINNINWKSGYNVFLGFNPLNTSCRHSSSLYNLHIHTMFLEPYVVKEKYTSI
jgi:hypothetical protein